MLTVYIGCCFTVCLSYPNGKVQIIMMFTDVLELKSRSAGMYEDKRDNRTPCITCIHIYIIRMLYSNIKSFATAPKKTFSVVFAIGLEKSVIFFLYTTPRSALISEYSYIIHRHSA